MKKFLLLMSHVGSRWQELAMFLKQDPCVDGDLDRLFDIHHPEDLAQIAAQPHKNKNTKAIWLVPILLNHQVTYRPILHYAKVVFFERIDGGTFDELLRNYTSDNALTYLKFRLRGMSQFIRHCLEARWLQWSDIPNTIVSPEIGGHDGLVKSAQKTSERYRDLRTKWNSSSCTICAHKN